jgi:hypothetical protein
VLYVKRTKLLIVGNKENKICAIFYIIFLLFPKSTRDKKGASQMMCMFESKKEQKKNR